MQNFVYAVAFLALAPSGWPLLFKLPHTFSQVFEAFRPGGFGISARTFWAFGEIDARYRSWYNKIARDYRNQGRFGYAWDDGLGMPLGTRIYNNWATYKLLYLLGTRWMMATGYLLIVVVVGILLAWRFSPWMGMLVSLLAAGSPLLVTAYTYRSKPEAFWWPLALVFVVAAFSWSGLLPGLLWSFMAFVNVPVSVMLAFLLGPALFAHSVPANALLGLAIGVSLGVLKLGLRGFTMWRSGYLGSLVSEQSRLWKRPWHLTIQELLIILPFILSTALSTYTSKLYVVGVLVMLVSVVLFWSNFRIYYLNDQQSFYLAFWAIGLGFAIAVGSLPGTLATLLVAYGQPQVLGVPAGRNAPHRSSAWHQKFSYMRDRLASYPDLSPLELPRPKSVMDFFGHMPDRTRFLVESDGDPRTASEFRRFWQWTEEFLPDRQIDRANEIYTRIVEPAFADRYLTRFNADHMTAEEMADLCEVIGASCVVAHTPEMVACLRNAGWRLLAEAEFSVEERLTQIFRMPPATLTLFRHPQPTTVISPTTDWLREGRTFRWNAVAHQAYTIRYRYHQYFQANQAGEAIPVEPVHSLPDLQLAFMRVRPISDGEVALRFRSRVF